MNRASCWCGMERKIVEMGLRENQNQGKPSILDAEKVAKQLCVLMKSGNWDF